MDFIKTAEGAFVETSLLLFTTLLFLKKVSGANTIAETKEFLSIRPINLGTLLLVIITGYCYLYFNLWLEKTTDYVTYFDLDFSKGEVVKSYAFSNVVWFVALCILTPTAEELIFRGIAFQRLINDGLNPSSVIILTSIIFCLFHFHYGWGLLALLPWSILVGYVRYKTGNLWYCIILHAQLNMFYF